MEPDDIVHALRARVLLSLLAAGIPGRAVAASAPSSPAAPTVWNLELPRGKAARTSVTVVDRCLAVHAFEVIGDPKAGWLSFPGATTVSVQPGGNAAVEALVDARTLDPGEHSALVTVRCLDCRSEPTCTQDRDVFEARLKTLWSDEDLRSFQSSEVFAGEVLVLVETGADRKAFKQLVQRLSLETAGSWDLPTIRRTLILLKGPGAASALGETVGALQKEPSIRQAQPNFVYRVSQDKGDDPYRDKQYALDRLGWTRVQNVSSGRGVTVAVLDSSVNAKHPDLGGAVTESADFFSKGRALATEGHGTAMTGIIAARAHNGVGIAGVAPLAAILAVRVCGAPSDRAHEICSSDAIARGLDFAIGRKARVMSMSLGGPYDPVVARLVYRAADEGSILVAATGNEGAPTVLFPAAYPPAIAVTAIDREDRLYERANRGARVDVAAPGVEIFTLAAPVSFGPTTGTSPATAQVSGAVALLLQLRPELSPADVRRLLIETARDLGAPGRDDLFGYGAIDVCAAVAKLTDDASLCREKPASP